MSVDYWILLVDWDAFVLKHKTAIDTEQVFLEDGEAVTEELSADAPSGDAMEATDFYNGIRSELPEEHLELCDRCFAASFWSPFQPDLDQIGSPPISPRAEFSIVDAETKGQIVYLRSLICPSKVVSLADAWQALPMESLRVALDSTYGEDDWQDWFESSEELLAYLEAWKAIFMEAAEKARGLVIRVG